MARRKPRQPQTSAPREAPAPARAPALIWSRLLALACGLIPTFCVYHQLPGWNGPYYWRWNYTDASPAPFLALGAVAWGAVLAAESLAAQRWKAALGVLAATQLLLTFSFVALSESSFATVKNRIESPDITSYYTVAQRLDSPREFLNEFHRRLPAMMGHARTHPPGPALYFYFWSQLLGEGRAALWSGMLLGVLAAAAIPLVYRLTWLVSEDLQAAFSAAALWALLPGVIVMLGSLDTVYPVLTLAMVIFWLRAVWQGHTASAIGLGLTAFAALLFAHNFLVLGAGFVLLAAMPFALKQTPHPPAAAVFRAAGIGLAALAAGFFLLWALTGYRHISALLRSMQLQEEIAVLLARPYHLTVFWDLYDFFLASGWLPLGLVIVFLWQWKQFPGKARLFAAAALLTIVVIDLSGLLRAETARVWLFLQPFAIPVAGMALARWGPVWRAAAYGAVILALVVIRSRLSFL